MKRFVLLILLVISFLKVNSQSTIPKIYYNKDDCSGEDLIKALKEENFVKAKFIQEKLKKCENSKRGRKIEDRDGDGHEDSKDAFPDDSSEWEDTDGDGEGNNKDIDDDGDNQSDENELASGSDPMDKNDKAPDLDEDNIPDKVDSDIDGDGIHNENDKYPFIKKDRYLEIDCDNRLVSFSGSNLYAVEYSNKNDCLNRNSKDLITNINFDCYRKEDKFIVPAFATSFLPVDNQLKELNTGFDSNQLNDLDAINRAWFRNIDSDIYNFQNHVITPCGKLVYLINHDGNVIKTNVGSEIFEPIVNATEKQKKLHNRLLFDIALIISLDHNARLIDLSLAEGKAALVTGTENNKELIFINVNRDITFTRLTNDTLSKQEHIKDMVNEGKLYDIYKSNYN
jgi:hypothetical protein